MLTLLQCCGIGKDRRGRWSCLQGWRGKNRGRPPCRSSAGCRTAGTDQLPGDCRESGGRGEGRRLSEKRIGERRWRKDLQTFISSSSSSASREISNFYKKFNYILKIKKICNIENALLFSKKNDLINNVNSEQIFNRCHSS